MDDSHIAIASKELSVTMMLGYRPEQRGSELHAGARAELMPMPETRALASMKGRLIAKILFALRPPQAFKNYIAIRIPAIIYVINQALANNVEHPLIAEFHAAYSPMGLLLTQDLPHIEYWEINFPEVSQDKRQRLHHARDVIIPPNLIFKAIDLSTTHLSHLFQERKADIISISGAYNSHTQFVQILAYLRRYLSDSGALVVTLPWQEGVNELRELLRFYATQVGSEIHPLRSYSAIEKLFAEAGFSRTTIFSLSDIAQEIGHPQPTNLEVIVTARA